MYDHCRLTSFDEYGLRAGFPPAYDKEHLCETSFSSYLLCIHLLCLIILQDFGYCKCDIMVVLLKLLLALCLLG